jgi:hypothetical protein
VTGEEEATNRFVNANEPIGQNQALADLIRIRNANLNRAIRKLILTLMIFSALVIVIGGANFIIIKEQNQKAAEARALLIQNTQRTKDCTEPEGQCFKDGQKRLGDAIKVLTQYNRISLACATTLPLGLNVDQKITSIDKCVNDHLTTPIPPGGN